MKILATYLKKQTHQYEVIYLWLPLDINNDYNMHVIITNSIIEREKIKIKTSLKRKKKKIIYKDPKGEKGSQNLSHYA